MRCSPPRDYEDSSRDLFTGHPEPCFRNVRVVTSQHPAGESQVTERLRFKSHTQRRGGERRGKPARCAPVPAASTSVGFDRTCKYGLASGMAGVLRGVCPQARSWEKKKGGGCPGCLLPAMDSRAGIGRPLPPGTFSISVTISVAEHRDSELGLLGLLIPVNSYTWRECLPLVRLGCRKLLMSLEAALDTIPPIRKYYY